jgi:hypothetical protein
MSWRKLEWWLVVLVAVHSYAVGVVLLTSSRWAASFGGWGDADLVFFVRQGGAFHLVVATGYLLEYFRHRTVRLMLFAKTVGVLFLTGSWVIDPGGAWAVPLSALGDAMMFLVVFWVHREVSRAQHVVSSGTSSPSSS